MKSVPLVSVVLPAFNAQEYIEESINSILDQSFRDFELIIVDDCSKDNTREIIQKLAQQDKRIIFIQNKENLKLSKTLNKGIRQARGRYIARMDADDWSFPERLEKQVLFMEAHKDIGIVGGFMQIMDKKGNVYAQRVYSTNDQSIRKNIFLYSPFSHPTIMMRKSILDKVGLYDHLYNPAEDYELYFRIGEISKFANLDSYLIKYRIVPGSMTTGALRKMEQKTIAVRFKIFRNSLYPPSFKDYIYTYLEYISLYIIPDSVKLWLFNTIRDKSIAN